MGGGLGGGVRLAEAARESGRARRVAILHVRDERPSAPRYQRLVSSLNGAALVVADALGWRTELVASAEAGVERSLEAARNADVVVVMGGEDVDPRFYRGERIYVDAGAHEPVADRAHIEVIRDAVDRGVPLLGICRGHQLVNVALGGTLIQHLPRDRHRDRSASSPFVAVGLEFEPGADLARDVDDGRFVRCTHHQAIAELGAGLRVAARSRDGVIEAVVHASAPVTGVQWHPEHPDVAADQLLPLFLRLERQLSQRRAEAFA